MWVLNRRPDLVLEIKTCSPKENTYEWSPNECTGITGEVWGWARKHVVDGGDSVCQGPGVEGTQTFEGLIEGECVERGSDSGCRSRTAWRLW